MFLARHQLDRVESRLLRTPKQQSRLRHPKSSKRLQEEYSVLQLYSGRRHATLLPKSELVLEQTHPE